MLSFKSIVLALYVASATAAPIRREVPQEHSHEAILRAVRTTLNINNPAGIQDPVFSLLGNAAAAKGQGSITDTDCLQQAVADQAFSNAKAANDITGMENALIFRALERNSGTVGGASAQCTSIQAVNPEIAAIQQHQDPASSGAAATNKAIVLALAQQIASIGGDPQRAIESGTFPPGQIGDSTGKGQTCDDENDAVGCIVSLNLLVPDATAEEINAAVAGGATSSSNVGSTGSGTAGGAAGTSSDNATSGAASSTVAAVATSGADLQTFTGALGGFTAPAVTNVGGNRPFVVEGSDSFVGVAAALGRSCDIQHNKCATAANSGSAAGLTVSQCDAQNTQCRAAATA